MAWTKSTPAQVFVYLLERKSTLAQGTCHKEAAKKVSYLQNTSPSRHRPLEAGFFFSLLSDAKMLLLSNLLVASLASSSSSS